MTLFLRLQLRPRWRLVKNLLQTHSRLSRTMHHTRLLTHCPPREVGDLKRGFDSPVRRWELLLRLIAPSHNHLVQRVRLLEGVTRKQQSVLQQRVILAHSLHATHGPLPPAGGASAERCHDTPPTPRATAPT